MLKKNPWIILVILFLGWAALSDINDRKDKNVKIDTKEKAMRYLNKVGKYHERLPYGRFKISFEDNIIHYWDNLDGGWTTSPKTSCYFTLKESSTYEMDYSENKNVKVRTWELEVSDKCWETDMKNILRLHLGEDGYLYKRDCYQPDCVCTRGW